MWNKNERDCLRMLSKSRGRRRRFWLLRCARSRLELQRVDAAAWSAAGAPGSRRRVVYAVDGGWSVLKVAAQAGSHEPELRLARNSRLRGLFRSVIGRSVCALMSRMEWQRRELHFIASERVPPLSEHLRGADVGICGQTFAAAVGAIAICCTCSVRPVDCSVWNLGVGLSSWTRGISCLPVGHAIFRSRGSCAASGQPWQATRARRATSSAMSWPAAGVMRLPSRRRCGACWKAQRKAASRRRCRLAARRRALLLSPGEREPGARSVALDARLRTSSSSRSSRRERQACAWKQQRCKRRKPRPTEELLPGPGRTRDEPRRRSRRGSRVCVRGVACQRLRTCGGGGVHARSGEAAGLSRSVAPIASDPTSLLAFRSRRRTSWRGSGVLPRGASRRCARRRRW